MNNCYKSKRALFIFAAPGLILFTVFVIYPILPEVLISLQRHDGFQSHGWVGAENYIKIFQDASFWKSQINTLIVVALSVLVEVPLCLLLALVIDKQTPRVRNFFKFSSVFPAVLSVTVISQMWVAMFEPQWGAINTLLQKLGLGAWTREWLTDGKLAIVCIAIAYLWQYVGLNCLLFYSGIKAIPTHYYEAAQIDGAGFWKASWHITVPLLKDITKYVLTISTLGSMGMFAHVRVMTAGGPGDASRTTIYQMYYTAFTRSEFGAGSAVAVVFIMECLIITLIINRCMRSERVEY